MKQIALALVAIVLVSAVAIGGDMAKSGQWGVQTSLGVAKSPIVSLSSLGLKFMASDNLAVRVEAGFASYTPQGINSSATTGYAFGAGFEYHMAAIGGVSPYLGLQAGYGSGSVPAPTVGTAPPTPATMTVTGVWGGEYFFSTNFSWGGEVGLGFSSTSNQPYYDPNSPTTAYGSATTIGIGSATMMITWYLN